MAQARAVDSVERGVLAEPAWARCESYEVEGLAFTVRFHISCAQMLAERPGIWEREARGALVKALREPAQREAFFESAPWRAGGPARSFEITLTRAPHGPYLDAGPVWELLGERREARALNLKPYGL